MREKINRLANGNTDVELPDLVIEPGSVEQSVPMGTLTRIELHINAKNNIAVKGLLYSSNYRVRVLNNSFGGVRNHVNLEVDASHLDLGESIKGEICAVTNAGEFIIPYHFTTFSSKTGTVLSALKTVRDFLIIYKEDKETALRIFEYKDFVLAPFMSDYQCRALYEHFAGKSNRASALEEFFVSLGEKPRIQVQALQKQYVLEDLQEDKLLFIELQKNTWGYINLTLSSDADFLEIEDKQIFDTDFTEGVFRCPCRIVHSKLQPGVNKATLRFKNIYLQESVCVELRQPAKEKRALSKTYLRDKKKFAAYLQYRLQYICADEDEKDILPELMRLELEEISEDYSWYQMVRLLIAETYFLRRQYDKVWEIIEEAEADIIYDEDAPGDEYLLLTYMKAYIHADFSQKEQLLDKVRQLEREYRRNSLFFLNLELDEGLQSSAALRYEYLLREFDLGNRSPFLYMQYIQLLKEQTAFLHDIGTFELEALLFGLRKDVLSPGLLELVKLRLSALPIYSHLSYHLLTGLYLKYKEDIYLSALCQFVIRADMRSAQTHRRLAEAVEKNITLSSLYEYYMYTLENPFLRELPENVFRYFLRNSALDLKYRCLLYENILYFYSKDSDLYRQYQYEIEKFALASLRGARLDKHLAFIYGKVLEEQMLDEDLAKFLPAILNSYMLRTKNPLIKSVVVLYPELKKELSYAMEDGKAYIPIFSEDALLLVGDSYGNRYCAFDLEKERIVELKHILLKCYELCPDHPMLRLKHTKELLQKTCLQEEDAQFLEVMMKSPELSDSFKSYIFSKLILHYKDGNKEAGAAGIWTARNHDALIKANKEALTAKQRDMITDAFVVMGYSVEAYDMLRRYKSFGMQQKNMDALAEQMVLDNLFKNDYLLLYISFLSFQAGNRNRLLLDYLCEYYNGGGEQMYLILEAAVGENVDTYDMEERLLAQLLFSGNRRFLDQTFAWYVSRKKTNDVVVRAYFAVKSADYVLYDIEAGDRVITYLENALFSEQVLDRIPMIYKLAMLKYYASLSVFTEERRIYAQSLLDNVLTHGLEFPFYKDLARWIAVPNEISDKQMLLYVAPNARIPVLYSRIIGEGRNFEKEDFLRMYQNIYVKAKVLFDNEIWEYQIFDGNDENVLLTKGSIKNVRTAQKGASKFDLINHLSNVSSEEEWQLAMEEFIIKEEIGRKIFTLM